MYNYQTYLRELELSRKCGELRKEHYKAIQHREKSNPSLIHSHKKRIEGFILSMIDKPAQVTQFINHPHSFRDEDNSKNLASDAFYLKHENQKQRIKEQTKKNSELDHVPFNNTYTHQFRQADSTSKGMKYKPINHNFRIKEFLDSQSLNYLPNNLSKAVDKSIKRARSKESFDIENVNKTINKSLLPLLHNKTYFKSVATLYAQLPLQWDPTGKYYQKQQATYEDNYEEGELQIKKDTKKSNDHMSRKQNSREALVKCNMLQVVKSDYLKHSKSGHVSCNLRS